MPTIKSAQLTPISELNDLRALQNLYLKDWPTHCVGFYWLDNFLRWLAKDKQIKHLSFYTLNNDWQTDGLFLIVHRYQLFFANLSRQQTPALITALSLLDWSHGFKVSSIYVEHHLAYKQLLTLREIKIELEKNTFMYHLPSQQAKALVVSCPADYYLDALQQNHAAVVNAHWTARHHGSLKLLELLIANNINMGLFEKSTKELCGWCLRLQSGFLGALFIMPQHQGQGLGALLASAMAKRIASELDHDVTALVDMGNVVACKLFEKLHFTLQHGEHYYWSMCPSTKTGYTWPSNE